MSSHPLPSGTIVVGTDGSLPGDQAVAWAADQAALEGRPLTLAYGTGVSQVTWVDSYAPPDDLLLDGARTAGEHLLTQTRARLAQSHPQVVVHTVVHTADPRQVLLDLSGRAAMVVVGSRGRGPVASLVLGSVSAAVSRHASCPVVVLRPRDADVTAPAPEHGILLGVDGHGRSSAAVEFAYRQASFRGVPLTVTYCFFDSFDVAASGGAVSRDATTIPWDTPGYETGRLVLDETVDGMGEKFPDVDVTLTLGLGPVDRFLAGSSRTNELVVVGTHAGGIPLGSLFGRHADRSLLTHASSAVAVVPEPDHS